MTQKIFKKGNWGRLGQPRPSHSYRGARRNRHFGRKAVGNTKPNERYVIWNKK